jgi:hypothetical protein
MGWLGIYLAVMDTTFGATLLLSHSHCPSLWYNSPAHYDWSTSRTKIFPALLGWSYRTNNGLTTASGIILQTVIQFKVFFVPGITRWAYSRKAPVMLMLSSWSIFYITSLLKRRMRKCHILRTKRKMFRYSRCFSAAIELKLLYLTHNPHFYCYKCLLRFVQVCRSTLFM